MAEWNAMFPHRKELREGQVVTWRDAETPTESPSSIIRPFRNCSYCGSIHPEDLLQFTKREKFVHHTTPYPEVIQHPHMEMADLKYGYPHKVYVTSKVLLFPDHEFITSSDGKGKVLSTKKGMVPFIKFYTQHLDDPSVSDADFLELTAIIEDFTGFDFTREAAGLMWRRARPKLPVTNPN